MKKKYIALFILTMLLTLTSSCDSQTKVENALPAPSQETIDKDLFKAIRKKDTKQVEILLKQGANPKVPLPKLDYNESPLYYAILVENSEIAELLLKYGASVKFDYKECDDYDKDCQDTMAIRSAVSNGDIKTTKVLMKYGGKLYDGLIHEESLTPDMVKFLVDNGVNINYPRGGAKGELTPLMLQAFWGNQENNFELLSALIDNGADLFLKDENGCDALCHASYHRFDSKGAEKLIKDAMDKQLKDKKEKKE